MKIAWKLPTVCVNLTEVDVDLRKLAIQYEMKYKSYSLMILESLCVQFLQKLVLLI